MGRDDSIVMAAASSEAIMVLACDQIDETTKYQRSSANDVSIRDDDIATPD